MKAYFIDLSIVIFALVIYPNVVNLIIKYKDKHK